MDVRESFQMAGRQPKTRYTTKAAMPAALNGILPATAPMNSVPMMVVSEGKLWIKLMVTGSASGNAAPKAARAGVTAPAPATMR